MFESIDAIIDNILKSYDELGGINHIEGANLPSRQSIIRIVENLESVIFPGYRDEVNLNKTNIRYIMGEKITRLARDLTDEVEKSYRYICRKKDKNCGIDCSCREDAESAVQHLFTEIPELRRKVKLDVEAALSGDPAARSIDEVILSYPGMEAIMVYRLAHLLWERDVPIIPRLMSEYIHGKTGVDIHPGATIGESFFIDHATGVVVGETTIIGNNVKIYQGVTLGALSVKKEQTDHKRHPTIEDDVTIYAGAKILGGETVIGKGSTIGGNVWLLHSVPPNSIITYQPENYIQKPGDKDTSDFHI
ncbi:MAG: serine acetyltransferase [Spirochaetales bacterium]|nr:serine acetyltransferase [Spirochaetales bacterium]